MNATGVPKICLLMILLMNYWVYSPVIFSKILILDEVGGSHYLVLQAIGEALARRGHNVTVFVSDMYKQKRNSPLFDFRIYKSQTTIDEWENELSNVTTSYLRGEDFVSQVISQVTAASLLSKVMKDQCHSVLLNKTLLDEFRSEKYDILIGDSFFFCASLVGQALDVQYALVSPPLPLSWHYSIFYHPVNPSYIPAVGTGFDSYMTFPQRALNSIQICFEVVLAIPQLAYYDYLKKVHNIRPDVSTFESIGHSEMWFLNSHFSLDFPRPLLPKSVLIGGVTTRPAKSLDQDLESFMQGADDGVVVFSLGGFVSIVDEDMADMFAKAFGQLRQRVVWKERGKTPGIKPANVKQMKWIPQNDLLGHPKTVLLVYHCGINGVFEAIYHAVPVVCLPVWYDQIDIAQRLASKGAGIRLDITSLTSQKLVKAIRRVIYEESFQKNMTKISDIFRDEPEHPADRAATWVEYLVRHGGAGHLRSAAHDLNFFQYHLIDVIAFLFVCAVTLMVSLVVCCRCFTRLVLKTCCARKVKND